MWSLFFIALGSFFCAEITAQPVKVLAFAGSTRDDSINKKLVRQAADIATNKGALVTYIDLKDYPTAIYEGDFEAKEGMPLKAKEFRRLMIDAQVIIIASPEFNGSLTALLKNTLDWASRSEEGGSSRDAFKGKKFVILSSSPGGGGGARGLVHLRSIIESIGGTVLSDQFVLPNGYAAFDDQGHLKDKTQVQELTNLIEKALKTP